MGIDCGLCGVKGLDQLFAHSQQFLSLHDAPPMLISDTWKLENPVLFGPNVSLGENVVHVLVVTPRQPHPARLKRWEKLNELLDGKKKARLNYADELSTVGPTGDARRSRQMTIWI
ncbi:hypothetical protein GQ600_25933 [Phytophthora cactorum]|nr:hypothetical protein GQ600_25933 [Phytophthora cactorum]